MKKFWIFLSVILLLLWGYGALAEDIKFVPYEDQENGFSFSYPYGWEVSEEEGFVFFAMNDEGLNVGVIKEEGFGVNKASLSDFAEEERNYLETELKDFKEIDLKDVEINEQKILLRIYEYKIKVRRFKSLEYYIQGKESGFVVVFDGPIGLFDKLKDIADRSISTFKLIGNEAIAPSEPKKEPKIIGRKIQPLEEWKTFVNKEKGFKVEYPTSWNVSNPYEDVVFEAKAPEGYLFQVLSHNLGKRGSVKGYFQGTGRWLKKHLNDYNELEAKEIDNGYERIYEYTERGSKQKVREVYYTKRTDEGNVQGFTLVFIAPVDKFSDAEEFFKRIENSFSLDISNVSPPAPPKPKEPETPPAPPKPETTEAPPAPPTPGTENKLKPDDFVEYKNAEGKFEVMVPKTLAQLDEDEDYVMYGDLSQGYLLAVGTDMIDMEEGMDMEIVKNKLREAVNNLGIEDVKVVDEPKEYKGGVIMGIETPKSLLPGMKKTTYYAILFVKLKGDSNIGLMVMLPKSDYSAHKEEIDFIIDSLK